MGGCRLGIRGQGHRAVCRHPDILHRGGSSPGHLHLAGFQQRPLVSSSARYIHAAFQQHCAVIAVVNSKQHCRPLLQAAPIANSRSPGHRHRGLQASPSPGCGNGLAN
ncbi:hypothetical protein E2562_036091 [Oryza meyeriana var. granulata]|uniref:Uncharacterized protein n=1 Tax=Oryza meyeriana var. granulata TaxID=110450 RepID=A0A6G1DSM3_9ORYZ|nr:hypothetical protein E2562_036091 [Oryza meyeriana var. granulata]